MIKNMYIVRIQEGSGTPFAVGPFTLEEAKQFREIARTAAGHSVEVLHLTSPEDMAQLANSMNMSELDSLRQRAH